MSTCAAPCGVELSPLNLINGDTVHEDCRRLYRECRAPLLEMLDWQRRMCPPCREAAAEGQVCQQCNRPHRNPPPLRRAPTEPVTQP
jgi:hypothetical protein